MTLNTALVTTTLARDVWNFTHQLLYGLIDKHNFDGIRLNQHNAILDGVKQALLTLHLHDSFDKPEADCGDYQVRHEDHR